MGFDLVARTLHRDRFGIGNTHQRGFLAYLEKQRFPSLMEKSLELNLFYFHQVIQYYGKKLPAGVTWHRSRRLSEAANNNLFACVQRMYEEPQAHQQEIDANFAKVGVNVRISREITNLAFSLEKIPFSDPLLSALEAYSGAIEGVFYRLLQRRDEVVLDEVIEVLNQQAELRKPEYEAIKTDLEKIAFELAALKAFRSR